MANRPDVKREAQISSLDSYNKDPVSGNSTYYTHLSSC